MAITTTENYEVNMLGINRNLREKILRALVGVYPANSAHDQNAPVSGITGAKILGFYHKYTDNSITDPKQDKTKYSQVTNPEFAIVGNAVYIRVCESLRVWIALSCTDPEIEVTEPDDQNYARKQISGAPLNTGLGDAVWNSLTGTSEYLSVTTDNVPTVENTIENDITEIKFNRSTKAWVDEDGAPILYKWFVLYDAIENGNMLAWGKLTQPIQVNQPNVVPLFEEGKLRLYFPAPSEVEEVVKNAALADASSN